MSADPDADVDTPAEKAEARAIRRRWITIGEAVAVAGVVIAGLGFWNSYAERRDADAERAATQHAQATEKAAARHRVSIVTSGVDARGIAFQTQAGCAIQSSEIRFPRALGVGTKSTVVTHRIEAKWIEAAMLKRTDGGPDRKEGRLPVLIDATCDAEDGERSEAALYDLLWRTEPGLFGRSLRLRGLVRHPGAAGGDQQRLDALWKAP